MKRITLSIGIIAILVIGAQLTMNVQPYYSEHFGDCGECHNTPAVAWNASNADAIVVADGEDDESVWVDLKADGLDETNRRVMGSATTGFNPLSQISL